MSSAEGVLEKHQGLEHLRVRSRGDLLILESKSQDGKEVYPHVPIPACFSPLLDNRNADQK